MLGVALAALLASACGGGGAGTDTSDRTESHAAPSAISQEELTKLPATTTFGTLSGTGADPGSESTGEVLHPKRDLVVYTEANGKPVAKLPTRQIGSPTWVPVVAKRGEWAQVLLPSRPNGSAGWIHATGDAVKRANNDFTVTVHRDEFRLEITKNGHSVGSWTIGTGKAAHPTPKGRAYIIASLKETVNSYSPIVLPLSYHSESHETFGGGPGTVGIHTWPDDSFVGQATSDGCIRVTQEALDELVKLPLGTIVEIV